MILPILYPEAAIKLYEQLDKIVALLSVTDWAIFRLLKPRMELFMRAQKLMGGYKYMTGRLVVPHIYDLREGLKKALVGFRGPAPACPVCEVLIEDFNNRWGAAKAY